jgi:hypothetical protein
MSLLRVLRNLAVLVILTVGSLGLIPRTMAATCLGGGAACTNGNQCCSHACMGGRCCYFVHGHYCTSWVQCCSRACIDHRCN